MTVALVAKVGAETVTLSIQTAVVSPPVSEVSVCSKASPKMPEQCSGHLLLSPGQLEKICHIFTMGTHTSYT